VKLVWHIWYRLYRLSSWLRYWAQRRFTPAGIGVLVAFIMAGFMGPDSENNVAYQAFTLLLCLLLLAGGSSWRFRARFSATRRLPRFGTVGAPLQYRVSVTNLSSRAQEGLTLLETLADPRPSFTEWHAAKMADEKHVRSFRLGQRRRSNSFRFAELKPAALPPIRAKGEVDIAAQVVPLRRGVLRFAGVTVAQPDPIGLFRAFSNVRLPQSTLILPKRYPLPPIALPGTMKYQAGGIALASNVGQSDEFVSLREYRHGDPVRHIHWRSWARIGKPVVREFEDEFFVRHALVLDTFTQDSHRDLFEEAVSVAASFACSIQTQESLLDLLFVGSQSYCFTVGRGLGHSEQMLEILASVQPCRDRSFSELEHLVIEHVRAVSGCIFVLLAWDEPRQKFVEKLRRLGIPILVLVIVPPAQAEEIDPGPMRDQPAQFRALELGQVEAGLAQISPA
jgi:uncharacterized protein (DUF58 family)